MLLVLVSSMSLEEDDVGDDEGSGSWSDCGADAAAFRSTSIGGSFWEVSVVIGCEFMVMVSPINTSFSVGGRRGGCKTDVQRLAIQATYHK